MYTRVVVLHKGIYEHLSSHLESGVPCCGGGDLFFGRSWSSVNQHPRFFIWKPAKMMLERRIRLSFFRRPSVQGVVYLHDSERLSSSVGEGVTVRIPVQSIV